ncbi:hypothetical protein RFI_29722 [Reticulomyxa filosa]|uniref:Uncharacterized protein n=1 Tax=Reticulomyxa filosa TaxID=46433 RepID=X6M0F3_RETFI|nr:hypothetical protein RFI_29722 [Reticulomyxa filosa]|eukprot:ETO07668.1 hypothetical protein RFI_29722 [Reticulomyxa filosa]
MNSLTAPLRQIARKIQMTEATRPQLDKNGNIYPQQKLFLIPDGQNFMSILHKKDDAKKIHVLSYVELRIPNNKKRICTGSESTVVYFTPKLLERDTLANIKRYFNWIQWKKVIEAIKIVDWDPIVSTLLQFLILI